MSNETTSCLCSFALCAAQICPALGEVWAKFFAGDSAIGGAFDVNTALGRNRANAVCPMVYEHSDKTHLPCERGLSAVLFGVVE